MTNLNEKSNGNHNQTHKVLKYIYVYIICWVGETYIFAVSMCRAARVIA